MRKKINYSLSAKIFIMVLTVLLLSGVIIYGSIMIFVPDNYSNILTAQFESQLNELIDTIDIDNIEESIPAIQEFSIANKTYISITTGDNKVIYEWKPEGMESMDENSESALSIAIGSEENIDFSINTSPTTESVNQIKDTLFRLLPFVLFLIFIVSTFSAFICSRLIAKPVVEISQISKRISNLDFTWSCNVNRKDEIGILADSLNEMAIKLDDGLKKLKSANEQLHNQMIQRNHLFAAISHELKTPITIMRCDLEGMLNNIGRYKDRDTYLQHALNTTETMEKLIQEILSVVKLESEDLVLNMAPAPIDELVVLYCKEFQHLADEKHIKLNCICDKKVMAYIDKVYFNKVISNIINNAIYHSPECSNVYVHLNSKDTIGILSVINTGVSISSEDFTHIFEPFYRIEKSRNRHNGGSGLGLFIVKTILDRHKFNYNFQKIKDGVQFTVYFPIANKS